MEAYYDYEVMHRCGYPVPAPWSPEGEASCGDPAAIRGYWTHSDGTPAGEMYLCQVHADIVLRSEQGEE